MKPLDRDLPNGYPVWFMFVFAKDEVSPTSLSVIYILVVMIKSLLILLASVIFFLPIWFLFGFANDEVNQLPPFRLFVLALFFEFLCQTF